jgi:GT2 family glycosyltransferase
MSARPPVSVVVPFLGDPEEATVLRGALGRLRLRDDDEAIVADNTPTGAFLSASEEESAGGTSLGPPGGPVRAVHAARERSSYHARNAGAREARNDWLLFIDADCEPSPDLLDFYFAGPIDERTGAVAGEIVGKPGQKGLIARYARDRSFLSQTGALLGPTKAAAATGNLLIRRAAFEELGGFAEGIRSGGDVDFCWRLRDAGWGLEFRPQAIVEHRHRQGLAAFLRAIARYAAGSRWLNERHPGSSERWPLLYGLAGSARDIVVNAAHGRFQEAAFRVIDALGLVAHNVGYRASNAAPPR